MTKFTNYLARRVRKLKALFYLKRFERRINEGWKLNLKLDGEKRIDHGIMLLEEEERLKRYKEYYAVM